MITLERLKEVLSYDPDSGEFRWKVRQGGSRVGAILTGRDSNGYLVDKRRYKAAHLAWLYTCGVWPAGYLDRRNRVSQRQQNSKSQRGDPPRKHL